MSLNDYEQALLIAGALKDIARSLDRRYRDHDERIVKLIRGYETAIDLLFTVEEMPSADQVRALSYVMMNGARAVCEEVNASLAASEAPDR